MKGTIAVEADLTPFKDYLVSKGFKVENINYGEMTSKKPVKVDAFVVTGMDTNFLGVHDTNNKAIVIDAAGMTPEQVYHELELRLE